MSPPTLNLLRSTSHLNRCYDHRYIPLTGTTAPTPDLFKMSRVEPGVTMWRFLNTLFILFVGTAKAILALQGQATAPTTLDWVIGVIWALMYV